MKSKKEYTAEDLLASRIEEIMSNELYIQQVPYCSDEHAMEISYESRQAAANKIVEYLKKENLLKDGNS